MRNLNTTNRFVALLLCGTFAFFCNPASGQDGQFPATLPLQGQPLSSELPKQLNDAQDSEKSFLEIVAEIRTNEAEINRLYSSIPIGFPEAQKEHMVRIDTLRTSNKQLKGQMKDAALRSYLADPAGNPEAAQIVFGLVINKLDGKGDGMHFDPQGALKVALEMLKTTRPNSDNPGGIDYNSVAYQAFRASFAIQDFDRAELLLQKIGATGIQLDSRIQKKLDVAKVKWQRELMIRRLETNTNDLPQIRFQTTEGNFVVELFENHAPQTVGNFINLVEKQYYDDQAFFLVEPGEFSRSGCRLGTGKSDAGYQIPCECNREEIRHHFAGTLSMYNDGLDTGSSQFFISHQPNAGFDGNYTAFGRVTEGLDVVFRLQSCDATSYAVNPENASKIIRTEVLRKRSHEYAPSRIAKKPGDDKVGDTRARSNSPLQTVQGKPGG